MSNIIANLTKEHFQKDKLTSWKIVFDQTVSPYDAVLRDVSDHIKSPGDRRPGFSLIFTTRQTKEYYQQGIYQLIHPELGPLSLFMVPLGAGSDGFMQYEIVFN